jgi:hypothetical protein
VFLSVFNSREYWKILNGSRNADKCAVDIKSIEFLMNINECSDSHTEDVYILRLSPLPVTGLQI